MSVRLADVLPAEVLALFEVPDQAEGQCFVLVTTDADRAPRPSVLSAGELLCLDPSTLRVGTWRSSRTTANLTSGRTAVLTAVAPPAVFHIYTTPKRLPDGACAELARFELAVVSVESDGHEGMPVVTPMGFRVLPELAQQTLRAWHVQRRDLAT
jgi:hypothetical protein